MRWRDEQRIDWTKIAESVCTWAASHPAGTPGQAIADLCLPHPSDKDMASFVGWTLRRKRTITPAMLDVLRDEWGCAYRISKLLSGRLSATRLNGSGEPMTAWCPDDLRRQLLADAASAWWPAVVAEAA
jgi:hypothetical protein